MNSTPILASLALLTAVASTSSLASGHEQPGRDSAATSVLRNSHERADRHDDGDRASDRERSARTRHGDGFDSGMQAASTAAGPGEPGYAWRYFSDPAAGRAVVISPQGEYFVSRGKGLTLVAVTQPRS